ncbi:sensor histidine kinase [Lactococcus petauri]|uniref:histidine kinase n=1 Tax=Lactococcus petauri TaxID=1940789 RepID=A0A252CBE7_9LACT|nr:ATP-binding protein [Lactococcus petauri]OUK03874.1 hypothetical protein BZZ03_09495 [Lactococcus petauri]
MDAEQLHYITEDKILAELLGKQNFSNKEAAILELVKNAYDAGSTKVTLEFKNSVAGLILIITDNGEGLDTESIRNSWMHVGKSTRGYFDNKTKRVYAGSKGVGRFALSRLGEDVEMYSKKEGSVGVTWQTDWEKAFLRLNHSLTTKGTQFIIKGLRDRWTSRSIEPLKNYLSIIYNDDRMVVEIKYGNTISEKVPRLWQEPKIGINYVSEITLSYASDTNCLTGVITSDEFKDSVSKISSKESIFSNKINKNMFDVLRKDIKLLIESDEDHEDDVLDETDFDNEAKELLTKLGDFTAVFYFGMAPTTQKNSDYFEYKRSRLENPYNSGIVLYRNAFSIDSFEGTKDWLGLNDRAVSSPAAATHRTGSWRVRPRNLSGYVEIDKNKNKYIEDLSNRQGIVQNIYFSLLKLIIIEGIKSFETFRQSIIREINDYKIKELKSKKTVPSEKQEVRNIFNNLRNNPEAIKSLTEGEISKVINEYERKEQESTEREQEKKELEEKFRYESQLLNVLATSQLKISSVGHEVKNDRNIIFQTPSDLEEAIRTELDWDELISQDVPFYRNIPELFNSLKDNTNKILNLADAILEETEKDKFKKELYTMDEIAHKIIDKWEYQYKWVNIYIDTDRSAECYISSDYLMVIFDNLILNSIQQNKQKQNLKISIKILLTDRFEFTYEDDGKGLDKKYQSNPMSILEVHESSRPNGHGLGMWILNNTLDKLDGEILEIKGEGGFYISGYFMCEV